MIRLLTNRQRLVRVWMIIGLTATTAGWSSFVNAQQPTTVEDSEQPKHSDQPSERTAAARATELFVRGRAAMGRYEFEKACAFFQESFDLDAKVGTLLNLANCQEQLGHWTSALDLWQKAATLAEQMADNRRGVALHHRDQLAKKIPHVVFELPDVAAGCTRLMLDQHQVPLENREVSVAIDPGDHHAVLSCPGHRDRRLEFSVQEAQRQRVLLMPGEPIERVGSSTRRHESKPRVTKHAVVARPHKPREQPQRPGQRDHLGAYVLGGIGVVGMAVAVASGILVVRARQTVDQHCDPEGACDSQGADAAARGKWLAVTNLAAWGIGVVGLGAGTFLYVRDSSSGNVVDDSAKHGILHGREIGVRIRGAF